jgi:starch phosphorylase
MEQIDAKQVYGYLPQDIIGIERLADLALDMRWSWNHAADEIWQQLDADLWELTHNPWLVLQTVSHSRLKALMTDPGFKKKVGDLVSNKEKIHTSDAWFQKSHAGSSLTCVAYFSMEFMLSEALPIYVGGLGNVAGDQLKSASDLGVPVVGVGLLYQQGYFRQEIDKYGNQQELFPYNDPGQLPLMPLRLPDGEWLRIKVMLSGHPVWLRTWQVKVGRVKLFLLDSNDAANVPAHRGITSELYGGGQDLRIKQEIILGIGGWKLLRALGILPEVCHLNEGHAAFLVLERAHDFMKSTGNSFEAALAITRAGNIFTTHTAVAAGFDHFSSSLMNQYLGTYAKNELGISFYDLMALGRKDPADESENFNMAYLAIRGSGAVNGVSRLHSEVSRELFSPLFPRWPLNEIPISYVTNGVHMPSWDSEMADEIWTEACGKGRWRGELEELEGVISVLPDHSLWNFRTNSRNNLISFLRKRFERQLTISGESGHVIESVRNVFNPHALTLGFARRFVSYKRPNLLLFDPERLIRILTNPEKPVQLVIAGKAPPFDESAKALIRQWVQFIQQYNLYQHVVFLSDYDMLLTEQLVQGVDVWINTPRRPWEACGTSGMKVLVNGGLNLSELDGWWAEAYSPEVGWALGDGKEHGDDPAWDVSEANELYDLLEQHVVPAFYNRNEQGIPELWIRKMRNSMATLTPRFSANRTVREYTEKYYIPAAHEFVQRAAEKGAAGFRIINAKHALQNYWQQIRLNDMNVKKIENGYEFNISIGLNGINTGELSVELFADGKNGNEPEKILMTEEGSAVKEPVHLFKAILNTRRPATDYTVRIVPHYEGISVPLENNLICWQK